MHRLQNPGTTRANNACKILTCLAVFALATVHAASTSAQQAAQAPDLSAAHISPTLYFSSSSEELESRNAVHARVQGLVKDLTRARTAMLPAILRQSDQIMINLQRHSAYLKVRSLENTQDQAAKEAGTAVETDQSVLEAAIRSRLRSVPKSQVSTLGSYALLAQQSSQDGSHALPPAVEHYRGAVIASFEQDMQSTYDRLIEALGSSEKVSSTDSSIRRAAILDRDDVYNRSAPRAAALLGSLVDLENRDAVAQGYENAALRKYESLGLGGRLVERTLAAVEAEAPIYRRYQEVLAEHTARKLGLTSILPAELNLGDTPSAPMSLAQSKELILDGLKPLGKSYTDRFASLLDTRNGRLDLSGGDHRSRAGTSISAYDVPVALYMGSYDGSLKRTSTLAHEGGHAIHRELMNASGIPIYQRTGPHYLSEGFAIFNELLVLDRACQLARGRAERESALEHLLAKISLELFTSAEETAFERMLYSEPSGNVFLDRPRVDAIYAASVNSYEFAPGREVYASREWMQKSLLFDDPLYLVNYLYAAVVAVALFEQAHTDPGFASKYEALLRGGFDADPQAMLARVGIRLNDPSLVKAAARLLQNKTDELHQLYQLDSQ